MIELFFNNFQQHAGSGLGADLKVRSQDPLDKPIDTKTHITALNKYIMVQYMLHVLYQRERNKTNGQQTLEAKTSILTLKGYHVGQG